MSGLGLHPDAVPLLLGLGALALLLFALGSLLGRWRVWVAGYFIVLIALAVAFFARDPGPHGPHGRSGPAAAERAAPSSPVQRSPADGVVGYVDTGAGGQPGMERTRWSGGS